MACCGIVGGARVGMRGGVALVLCVGLRVLAVDCCSLGRVEGPLISSGNRKECILAESTVVGNVCDVRARLGVGWKSTYTHSLVMYISNAAPQHRTSESFCLTFAARL
jgi:hypothetical protein